MPWGDLCTRAGQACSHLLQRALLSLEIGHLTEDADDRQLLVAHDTALRLGVRIELAVIIACLAVLSLSRDRYGN